jgi:thioesterase domain-containing protein
VRRQANRPSFGSPDEAAPTEARSALVTIQVGSGSRPPLFCVHAEAGHVRLYYALARHLPREQSVYGLITLAAGEGGQPERLERMAERHLREIRRVQPNGPYVIVGECTGGSLAYEIAQQLRAAGEEISLLALVDAFRPDLPRLLRFVPRPAYKAVHRVRILGFHCGNLVRLDPRAKLAYATSRADRVREASAARASAALHRSAKTVTPQAAFREALAVYTPKPYAGRVILFRAGRLPLGIVAAPDLGWAGLIERLQVELVPGYFTTPISEPGVKILAELLAGHLSAWGGES